MKIEGISVAETRIVELTEELGSALAIISRLTEERDGWKAEHATLLNDISPVIAERDGLRKALEDLVFAVDRDASLSPHHPHKNAAIAALEVTTRAAHAALSTPPDTDALQGGGK